MHLSQLKKGGVVCRQGSDARLVNGATTTYALAQEAVESGQKLLTVIESHGFGDTVDLEKLAGEGALDVPVRHPDAAHMHLTGTGLTHLGSASARDAMHADEAGMSDSMKMFRMGIEGGKPEAGKDGVQPEWFYKGTGVAAVAPGDPLASPDCALDGGEEPEIAGFYIIGKDCRPSRIGFSLANEFSDHVTERINYLYLAHSKLRPASFGPELLVGDLPADIRGTSRILRDGKVIWEKEFLSGEDNMSHSIANLEFHHFKYGLFCQPGDLHVHMFGTATLSFADGISCGEGDEFEISAPEFGLPLRNPHAREKKRAATVEIL
ncbi:AraD1 family protein [Chelativorans sp. YIM 93263]|uniref:AraD1 family protein n=1 Tax=Chelativorans sp. YIM 93263 TaxID=2906648 RepID=UPI002378ACF5|nr:AraD1 family protein [Chelativorans sp. YIM 93263]